DGDLIKKFKGIREIWVEWFVPGGACEPIGIRGEQIVRELLKGSKHPEKVLSLLTTSTKKSFSRRELEELLRIAIEVKKGAGKVKLLEGHAKKWFWLHNNYSKSEMLGAEKFEGDWNTIFSNYPDPEKYLGELESSGRAMAREKEQMIQEMSFNKEQRRLIEVLDIHAWYQDYRKEWTMVMLHYLDLILNEIAKRKSMGLGDLRWLLADEILNAFDGADYSDLIEKRKKHSFFVWEKEQFGEFAGEAAKEKERSILRKVKNAKEIVEIPGNIANRGLVRGIARVTMSPDEAKHLKKGEILVTSMTSPDFISAIKKAAAIVTNEGGILCHAAIVSREFGIPCIVGTGIATKTIKDGEFIEVDGNHGFVRILKGE
ncbi:hypothetical protein HZC08_01905, partial [Candidatus Micrarchaeota archaeon]|nr:hypothetical protein [Candidatus Micrarchaeota archaeon]